MCMKWFHKGHPRREYTKLFWFFTWYACYSNLSEYKIWSIYVCENNTYLLSTTNIFKQGKRIILQQPFSYKCTDSKSSSFINDTMFKGLHNQQVCCFWRNKDPISDTIAFDIEIQNRKKVLNQSVIKLRLLLLTCEFGKRAYTHI